MSGRKTFVLVLIALSFSLLSWAQTKSSVGVEHPLDVRPTNRLTGHITDQRLVRLIGNRHPAARPDNMIGELSSDHRLEHMVLLLSPDAAQKEALQELIRAQQDPASPHYHQWLTPEAFGERFGISRNDLNEVVNWLDTQGMKVDEIPSSHRYIVFSGSAGQVETTFHTQMRRYSVNGETHFANATDLEIPEALREVVHGVVSLHDFRSAPAHETVPAYTLANGVNLLMPLDWATIYDVTPLYNQGLDGTGQSIAVVGRTDVDLTDVRTFRTNAGLPANDPQKIFVNGVNPGMPNCNDESESALDVEWAGAIAKNAVVKFVTAASGATDGIILAAQYAVANNVAPIVTVSYLHCEGTLSDGGLSLWGALWAQAAAQGQSIFVSSGDSGAAGCDLAIAKTATQGVAVNAICSSPDSTCVGGTQFNDTYNQGTYWTATNGAGQSSVLSYIPEQAWNETSWSGMINTSSGGGVSTVYSKPGWQSAPGVPAGNMRYVPDISATSAVHDGYVIQIQGKPFYVAGTSAAAPSLGSVMALVLQSAGAPLGNINPALYTLAGQQAAGGPAVFHDITSGNNSVPGVAGYSAGPGYDMVTGLGSINAFLLVNSWSNSLASNFTIAASSSTLSVLPGSSKVATLTMSAQGGFSSPVALSAAGAPSGVTVTFSSPNLTTAGPVAMTVTAAANAAAGTFPIAVTGTGGGFKRTIVSAVTIAAPTFTLSANPTGVPLAAGASASITLTVAGTNGFNSAVALAVTGAPGGVTATFSPKSITSPNGSSTLKLSAASGTAAGTYALAVTATSGTIIQTQTITLAVTASAFTLTANAASITVNRGGSGSFTVTTTAGTGFNSAVSFSLSGVPNGVTASFSRGSIVAPGSGSSTLTLTAGTAASAGVSTVTLSAAGGGVTRSQTFTLTVLAPAFTLTAGAVGATLSPNGSISIPLITAGGVGFKSAIALSIAGLPPGVTASFAPATVATPGTGSSTLKLSAAAGATPGTYTLVVTATGGGMTRTQTLSLTVLTPTFTLTSNASSLSVAAGGSKTITLTTSAVNGFKSALALSISATPKGVATKFSSTAIASAGSGSSVLTVTVASGTAVGTCTLTVTATGGGITKTQAISLAY
jgi:pseudomonalisin